MAPAFDDDDLNMSISGPGKTDGANQQKERRDGHQSQTSNPYEVTRREDTKAQERTAQRLGQYSIQRTLGEGSFGKVKLAVHRGDGRQVALKIISRKKLTNSDMAGRVEREIAYLQLLRHPHIIKL
jgi:carbon catabolite-derepressing protein kinase